MTDPASEFLRERHPEALELAEWARAQIRAADPDLAERVYRGWDGIGYRHEAAGYVAGLFPRGAEVALLLEHGAAIPDPEGRLEGEGTQTRTFPLREPSEEAARAIRELVHAAIAQGLERAALRRRRA